MIAGATTGSGVFGSGAFVSGAFGSGDLRSRVSSDGELGVPRAATIRWGEARPAWSPFESTFVGGTTTGTTGSAGSFFSATWISSAEMATSRLFCFFACLWRV